VGEQILGILSFDKNLKKKKKKKKKKKIKKKLEMNIIYGEAGWILK
jgi:hypothetical protein